MNIDKICNEFKANGIVIIENFLNEIEISNLKFYRYEVQEK